MNVLRVLNCNSRTNRSRFFLIHSFPEMQNKYDVRSARRVLIFNQTKRVARWHDVELYRCRRLFKYENSTQTRVKKNRNLSCLMLSISLGLIWVILAQMNPVMSNVLTPEVILTDGTNFIVSTESSSKPSLRPDSIY